MGKKIGKSFRKIRRISRKIRRRVFADFSGFLGYRRQFRDGGDCKADWPAGPRQCGIPVVVADRGAGAHAWVMARVWAVPAGFAARAPRGKESIGVSKGGK
jgi:hypothetical protein